MIETDVSYQTLVVCSQDDRADTADDDDDDDNLSTISGLSDLSGADWKPSGAGPFSWVQHHMMKGTDPRHLLKDMIAADTVIPDHLDQVIIQNYNQLFHTLTTVVTELATVKDNSRQ